MYSIVSIHHWTLSLLASRILNGAMNRPEMTSDRAPACTPPMSLFTRSGYLSTCVYTTRNLLASSVDLRRKTEYRYNRLRLFHKPVNAHGQKMWKWRKKRDKTSKLLKSTVRRYKSQLNRTTQQNIRCKARSSRCIKPFYTKTPNHK